MNLGEATAALTQVQDLVAPDGAKLELLSIDEISRSVQLQLHLDDVECLECILPRDYLERLALSVLQGPLPQLQRVAIVDPREQA